MSETYLIPDLLAEKLRVVFCGTALGRVSYEKRAYYANPGNYFWRTLHQCGFIPEPVAAKNYHKVLEYRIGLTDMCKIAYGNDSDIPHMAYDRTALEQKIRTYQPDWLAFTSKNAASIFLQRDTSKITYGIQPETIDRTQIFVLPSPSGHARKWWDKSLWQQLAKLTRQEP